MNGWRRKNQFENLFCHSKNSHFAILGISYFSYQIEVLSGPGKRVRTVVMTSFCAVPTLVPEKRSFENLV